MGKLNLANISTGLNKVKSIAESLSNVAHFENVPTDCIKPALTKGGNVIFITSPPDY